MSSNSDRPESQPDLPIPLPPGSGPLRERAGRNIMQTLTDRRDGLLREAEYLEKRLRAISEEVTELNSQIAPRWPE